MSPILFFLTIDEWPFRQTGILKLNSFGLIEASRQNDLEMREM